MADHYTYKKMGECQLRYDGSIEKHEMKVSIQLLSTAFLYRYDEETNTHQKGISVNQEILVEEPHTAAWVCEE